MLAASAYTVEVGVADSLLLERDGAVATVTFNQPESMNSASLEVKADLLDALEQVRHDAAIRALVLTGAGKAFCVGQDLREHAQVLRSGDRAPMNTVREHYNPITLALATMPKPVIAAINGMAAGAGASWAFAADFRLAADSAAFLLAFARVGLSADSGASWFLPRLVGHARATALLLLAEPISAAQALEMGLVTAVVPDDRLQEAARELADRLAAGPTAAYGLIKESLMYAGTVDLPAALEREAQLQALAAATQDHRASTEAFLAKDRPVYAGR